MKATFLIFSLMLSFTALAAGTATLTTVLEQTEVQELETKLAEKGFHLVQVKDKFAEADVRPRCICESLELTFRKAGPAPKVATFAVSTTGFGNRMSIKITKK